MPSEHQRIMNKKRRLAVCLLVLMTAVACSAPLTKGDPGWVALAPWTDPESGIQGVAPQVCTQVNSGAFDCADLTPDSSTVTLLQISVPDTTDKDRAIQRAGIPLERLPEPRDTYAGHALTWDLYTVYDQTADPDPQGRRTDLGLATNGSHVYLVALTAPSAAYDAHRRLYDTVFTHALYKLEPAD